MVSQVLLGEVSRLLSEWCHVVNERDVSPAMWRSLRKAWKDLTPKLPAFDLPRRISAGTVFWDQHGGTAYTIGKPLGKGGNGAVYECDAKDIGKVAIKFPLAWRKFPSYMYEARGVVQRKVPFTTRHYYTDHVAMEGVWGRFPVIIMELMAGGSLEALRQQQLQKHGTGFAAQDTARYMHGVCASLLALQMVHCDIKPDNILLDADGNPCLTDFGLSLPVDFKIRRSLGYDVLKQAGTPGYMSPEQVTAMTQLTHRSDIYAIGALGFSLYSGRKPVPPQRGENPRDYMRRAVTEKIDYSPLDNDYLRGIIQKCLQIPLVGRYQKLEDLMHDLDPLKAGLYAV